jgi:hypothetical protein
MSTRRHDDLLRIYARYLKERGYQCAKIHETATRTPDLEVRGPKNSYLNEFKAPEHLLDPATGMYKFSTTNSKLWNSIHKAIKQLSAHDPTHAKPWVITFASVNFQLCWNSLFEAMQGGAIVDGKVMFNWTKSEEFKRWTAESHVPDLYVWLQVNQTEPYQASFFTNDRSRHRAAVDELVTSLQAARLSEMDTNWLFVQAPAAT